MFQFEVYCLDTYEFLLTTWPWIRVSETVHRLLAHTTDIIILNKNQGLLRIGEQGSESMHKVQRLTRAAGARKSSLLLGDVDTFRRGWAASSPALRALDKHPWCSWCKTSSHFTRSCRSLHNGLPLQHDDTLVESFFCTAANEPEEQKNLI